MGTATLLESLSNIAYYLNTVTQHEIAKPKATILNNIPYIRGSITVSPNSM